MKQHLHILRLRLSHWLREERGNLTVDFAMIMPLAIAVFLASVEASVISLRKTYLDRALDMTVRELRLGKIANPTRQALKEKICSRMIMVDNCVAKLTLELNVQSTVNAIGNDVALNVPSLSNLCIDRNTAVEPVLNFIPGAANDLVLVRACLVQSIVFPTSAGQVTEMPVIEVGDTVNQQYQLISTTAFVNEPR